MRPLRGTDSPERGNRRNAVPHLTRPFGPPSPRGRADGAVHIHNEDRSWRGLLYKPCKCVRFCDHLQGADVGRVPWPRQAGGMTARGWVVDPGPGGTDGAGCLVRVRRWGHDPTLQRERKIEGSCPAVAGVGVVYMSKRKAVDLTKKAFCAKITADRGPSIWISCPACGNVRFLEVYPETKCGAMPVYCKRCRRYVPVDID